MIASFEPLDQSILTLLRERDPLVERYRAFFSLLDWAAIEPLLHRDHPSGPHPHPETAYIKAFLLKILEEKRYITQLRRFLVEHPLLVEEVDGLGEVITIDVKHIYAWVRENNPRESIHYRFKKENQPKGDPECCVGGKSSTTMIQADGSTKERTEYLWGYGTGVVAATSPVYGDIVLAEYTQTFNQTDVTYHQELYQRTVLALGGYPLHQAADAA